LRDKALVKNNVGASWKKLLDESSGAHWTISQRKSPRDEGGCVYLIYQCTGLVLPQKQNALKPQKGEASKKRFAQYKLKNLNS